MSAAIGYYVHHQGEGHRRRAAAIAAAYDGPVTLLGTGLADWSSERPCINLPDDRMAEGDEFGGADGALRPASLHYAPLDHEGVRQRTAMIARWIAEARPSLMVVDVSVEAAMLARLASVPYVYVRLNGRRGDRPHLDAFAASAGLLAPYPAALEDLGTPGWVVRSTFYAPGIVPPVRAFAQQPDRVLVVIGRGGSAADGARWAAAAASVPDRRWRVIGPCSAPADLPPNLEIAGWVDDADAEIAGAGVVIGAAGDGLVSAVLAHARPFICFPEPRPYDEQLLKAKRLAAINAAVVPGEWPGPGRWKTLIDTAVAQARSRDPALSPRDGAARAAAWLAQLASGKGRRPQ